MRQATRYVEQDRGDRLTPRRFHPRRHVLVGLAGCLGTLLDGLPAGERALDFGCGSRPYEPLLHRRFTTYVAADLAGNPAADVVIGADGRLPADVPAFDCVLSSQVLEHVANPDVYLAEAHRVLKPGASLVLSTHGLWLHHPDPVDYWRWTAAGLRTQVERAGFEVLQQHGILAPGAAVLQLFQDVTVQRLPRVLRPAWIAGMQLAVGFADTHRASARSEDAAVHVVYARRR